jgi:hypothetical protein
MNMRKIIVGFMLAFLLFGAHNGVLAQDTSKREGIIPAPKDTDTQTCESLIFKHTSIVEGKRKINQKDLRKDLMNTAIISLGTKIKGGCVQLRDVPFIVIHLIDLFTKLAGTIAVIFLLYAGFQMIVSGVTDDREKAKNTIKYAVTGLIVSFLAWVIVNLVQVQLTS